MPSRRQMLFGAAALAATSTGVAVGGRLWRRFAQPEAPVAVLRVSSYEEDLLRIIREGISLFPETVARLRGARVLLKPNLVEVHPGRPIHTDPRVVLAAAEAMRALGAAEVIVGEAAGHHRDTEALLEASGLGPALRAARLPFIDLNIADSAPLTLRHDLTGLGALQLPTVVTGCDLLVSLPKMKTHHWVGATLSLKNLFGVVPGLVYGWPKNVLHHAGIDRSIVDLWTSLRPGFAIIDGVVGMEGDGPVMGAPIGAGVLVMGPQLPAVDATAARIMGLDPHRMGYLEATGRLGGTVAASRIAQRGEAPPALSFAPPPTGAGVGHPG